MNNIISIPEDLIDGTIMASIALIVKGQLGKRIEVEPVLVKGFDVNYDGYVELLKLKQNLTAVNERITTIKTSIEKTLTDMATKIQTLQKEITKIKNNPLNEIGG